MATELQANARTASTATEPPHDASAIDPIEDIERHLNGLPARQQMTVQSTIQKLKQSIEKLRARGYKLDEVATELKKHGLHMSGRTLARHLRSAAPKRRVSAAP